MKRYLTWIILIGAGLALTGAMVNPVYHSSVYIGGGPADADGGAQIENTGDAEFSGTVKVGELETDALTAEGELTITGNLSVMGDVDCGDLYTSGGVWAKGGYLASGNFLGLTPTAGGLEIYGGENTEAGRIFIYNSSLYDTDMSAWRVGPSVSTGKLTISGLTPLSATINYLGFSDTENLTEVYGGLKVGANGADGVAGSITLCDGANPGSTETLTFAKWNSLNDTNGIVKCNGSGTFSAASAGTDYCAAAGGTGIVTTGTITTGVWNAGAVTSSGALTGTSAVIGGGYGSTGATISDAGVIQADGAITGNYFTAYSPTSAQYTPQNMYFTAKNSANEVLNYGRMYTYIDDNTDGSEDTVLNVQAIVAGTLGTRLSINQYGFSAQQVYDLTTATAANVNVDSGGYMKRSTSGAKYKTDIQDYNNTEALMGLLPRTFRSVVDEASNVKNKQRVVAGLKAEKKELIALGKPVEILDARIAAAEAEAAKPAPQTRYLGFVAEEVATVEPMLVGLDETGAPDSVAYDRITVLLVATVKEQQQRIEEQDIIIEDLARRLEKLEKDNGGGQRADAGVPYDDDNSIPDGADDLVYRPGLDSSPAMALLMGNN